MDEHDEQLPSSTSLLHHKGSLAFQNARRTHSDPEAGRKNTQSNEIMT